MVEESLRGRTAIMIHDLVEENGKTFFVPYFHRSLEDYLCVARRYFSDVEFFELMPLGETIDLCKREKHSPLYDHPGNVYYPEITQMPSALIFSVKK